MVAGEIDRKKEEEMKDELFDKRIKELISSCSQTPPSDVWDRIEAGLDRRKRRTVWRNLVYGSVAAAVAVGMLSVTLLLTDNMQRRPSVQVAETVEESEPAIGPRRGVPRLKALPEIRTEVVAQAVPGGIEIPVSRPVTTVDKGNKAVVKIKEKHKSEEAKRLEYRLPSIYDQTRQSEYIAMAAADDYDARREKRKPSLSVSAGGNLSPTHASGNVDFSQPNFSWGAGGSSSTSAGIVPVSEPRHYFPVSVGLELRYSFLNDRLGVGLGVNYTFLNSTYEALVDRQYQASVDQSVHYIGVPLNFYVNILSGDRLHFYATAGCMMERAVKISYGITDLYSVKYQQDRSAQGLQWSVNAGLGLEYRFLDFLGVYLDPRLTYFFDCGQPYSVRTEQPLQFNLQLGFRFHI